MRYTIFALGLLITLSVSANATAYHSRTHHHYQHNDQGAHHYGTGHHAHGGQPR